MKKKDKTLLIVKIICLLIGSLFIFFFTREYLNNKKIADSQVINIYEIAANDITYYSNEYLLGRYKKEDIIYSMINTYNSTCSNTLITINYSKELCNELYNLIDLINTNNHNINDSNIKVSINTITNMIKK